MTTQFWTEDGMKNYEIFIEGVQAKFVGKTHFDNPYKLNSPEYLDWNSGWWGATNIPTSYDDVLNPFNSATSQFPDINYKIVQLEPVQIS